MPDPLIFSWWWCEECEEEFQDKGVGVLCCPFCGSKNVEEGDDDV